MKITKRNVISILIKSPLYFHMNLVERMEAIKYYIKHHEGENIS